MSKPGPRSKNYISSTDGITLEDMIARHGEELLPPQRNQPLTWGLNKSQAQSLGWGNELDDMLGSEILPEEDVPAVFQHGHPSKFR